MNKDFFTVLSSKMPYDIVKSFSQNISHLRKAQTLILCFVTPTAQF